MCESRVEKFIQRVVSQRVVSKIHVSRSKCRIQTKLSGKRH